MKHIVSFSGGKDSTAMLLRLVEEGVRIDEVIFCDTGVEFDDMYAHVDRISKEVFPVTVLNHEKDYSYWLYQADIKRRNKAYEGVKGYGWPRFNNRWCTSAFKTHLSSKYLNEKYGDDYVLYIGIARDELERVPDNIGNMRYPLVLWHMRERDCLKYCYKRGYDWNGLYHRFARVSCFCCPFKRIGELRNMYWYYPDQWAKLYEMDQLSPTQFRKDYTLEELKVRFLTEGISMCGIYDKDILREIELEEEVGTIEEFAEEFGF